MAVELEQGNDKYHIPGPRIAWKSSPVGNPAHNAGTECWDATVLERNPDINLWIVDPDLRGKDPGIVGYLGNWLPGMIL